MSAWIFSSQEILDPQFVVVFKFINYNIVVYFIKEVLNIAYLEENLSEHTFTQLGEANYICTRNF